MTLRERIREDLQEYDGWTRAYDSHQGEYVQIRRLQRDPLASGSDAWMIKDTRQRLFSTRGTLPLYITIIK